jgi:dTMP kinase
VSERGRFISLEGGEGVGKSTQARALHEALSERGIDCLLTREPGGSEGAEAIRELLLGGEDARWSVRTEALLFAAARADHVEKTIKPALATGKWVISDRFLDSSLAYQGGAGGLGFDPIRTLHDFGSQGFLPDRTLVILFDNKDGIERARARDMSGSDRIGGRSLNFHYEVFLAFQHIYAEEPERVRLIDGSGEPEAVTRILLNAIADLLP